ncbi:HipA domain-containing protein [Citricoccus sp. NPDC079358]|uniref:HipA domain-containing protein n=1 Tax=Citricoccus sp. NPDC079358 TaxID=3154653 RepID=UPI00344EA1E5
MVAIRLQSFAGITVQPSRLMPLGEYRNIFLTHRFDRDGDRRIPYMSMRSALQLTDGEHPRPGYPRPLGGCRQLPAHPGRCSRHPAPGGPGRLPLVRRGPGPRGGS